LLAACFGAPPDAECAACQCATAQGLAACITVWYCMARYDLVRFACFGIQEVSPLNPLPYPFPGSLELFEKFQASPFPTIFIFRIQMKSNITEMWQSISTTHSYPFGQESCDNKTWCLQMIWLGSAVDPK
jgi:hypothetical protein